MMIKLDPIIAVQNIEASANWYRHIFGFKNVHGGENFAVLTNENDDIVLCLHKWGEHGHPSLTEQNKPTGNGLLLYFRTTEKLEAIKKRVDKVAGEITEEIHLNPNSLRTEFSFKDPDGYYLTITEFHTYEG